MYVVPLTQCEDKLAPKIGGKGKGLGYLIQSGFVVPPGFVVTTDAYNLGVGNIRETIASNLEGIETVQQAERASKQIVSLFDRSLFTEELRDAVITQYCGMGEQGQCKVAVRSSATAEDLEGASFAGQHDTYLFVSGVENVIDNILKCWASLYSPQAIGYRAKFDIPSAGLAMAVVVQKMVDAQAAGVMMSLDPVNGNPDKIYIESALGLGEGVVRGDVGIDRFWVDKQTLTIAKKDIAVKQKAHHLDAIHHTVGIMDVPEQLQRLPSLKEDEVIALAELALKAEKPFASAVDMEWAVEESNEGKRTLYLLQARPETVWQGRPVYDKVQELGALDEWNPLHAFSKPDIHWATSNLGEAMPGVSTPLSWSIWGPVAESALRGGAHAVGALSDNERKVPDAMEERIARIFFGRPAMAVQFLALVGDRMPGTTGQQVVRDILGSVPEGISFSPTRKRYGAVALRLPKNFFSAPGAARKLASETTAWWQECQQELPQSNLDVALRTANSAAEKLDYAVTLQAAVLLGIVTPLYNAVSELIAKTGIGDTAVLGGVGGAEMEMVSDIWRASRGEISVDDVINRHGFHGPMEGELSSTVWREDSSPLKRLIADYALRDDSANPVLQAQARHQKADNVRHLLLAALPAWQRPFASKLLKIAAERIPLRGVCKRSFLQLLDITRIAARRMGDILVKDGKLDKSEDIFYLTLAELNKPLIDDVKTLVAKRRARRDAYQKVTLPSEWQGMPEPVVDGDASGQSDVQGVGVSPGVIEGRARVLLTPEFDQVKSGEILVTPTTDPSWSSVMFISAGLVVDIGGALSHAAIVARELGIPCVVNTQSGSRTIKTGSLLRVDGNNGTVTVLEHESIEEELRHG